MAAPGDAFSLAAKLLARREHSAHELRQKLQARGFGGEMVASALQRVQEIGLQSDRRFCDSYINTHRQRFGDYRLRAELAKRGVNAEEAAAALTAAALLPGGERAAEILRKKYPRGLPAKDEQRAQRFLHSRGFGGGDIRAALAALRA